MSSLTGNPAMKTGFSLCGNTTQGKPCSGNVLALEGIAVLCNSNSSDYTTFFLMHSRVNKKLTFDGYRPGRMAVMEHLRGKMQFCAAFPVCIFG